MQEQCEGALHLVAEVDMSRCVDEVDEVQLASAVGGDVLGKHAHRLRLDCDAELARYLQLTRHTSHATFQT